MDKHEYEPGEIHYAMHTDPACKICGLAKNAGIHDVGK